MKFNPAKDFFTLDFQITATLYYFEAYRFLECSFVKY